MPHRETADGRSNCDMANGDRWEFVGAEGETWTWCRIDGSVQCSSAAFSDFAVALRDATINGFDPGRNYWLVMSKGRTTHFRPGKTPINLPSYEDPPT